MKRLKELSLLLLICFCILQGHVGVGYKNEVEIKPEPSEDSTPQKTGFFSGIKNFFRGSATTAAPPTPKTLPQNSLPQHKPPPLTISQAPLVPLGPRPDTPSSSAFGVQPNQPPQWPQPQQQPAQSEISRNFPENVASQQNTHGQRPEQNFPPGFSHYRPEKSQPSGFDLSYGGANGAGGRSPNDNRPGFGLAPLTSSTTSTTSTTMRPTQPQHPSSPQKPQQPHMDIDLRIRTHEDFPPLPSPKLPSPVHPPPSHPSSPPAGNKNPVPPRTEALAPSPPSPPSPNSPYHPPSPAIPAHNSGNRVSFIPSNGYETHNNGNKQLATDDEIQQLTENLYTKEVNSQLALIRVNIQGKTRSIDSTDEAPNHLLAVDNRALEAPTIVKLRPLFNNYEIDTMVNEYVTPNERREENEFLDAIMNTNVMRQAMLFLQNKGIVTPDPRSHRDLVKELWFTQYSRGQGKVGSSGFEHVFVNEVKNGTIIGLHNWVYFYQEEQAGRLDYKGYMKELDIGTKGKVLKARFTHNGLNKPVNTLFIGTSPELELALYTVCFKLRPDRTCPVSLGNSKFGIVTYSWRYRGKNLIGSAYPEI